MRTKIIFLDIDGVLNSRETAEYYKTLYPQERCFGGFFSEHEPATIQNTKFGQALVDNLKKIVEATNAQIVISSTWRISFSVPKFKEMFTLYGFDAPVIDKTPCLLFPQERGEEVARWVNKHKPSAYVILDDSTYNFFKLHPKNLIWVNSDIGLSAQRIEKAINILNQT